VCIRFGLIKVALITTRAPDDPDGSISLFISPAPRLGGGFLRGAEA